MSLRSITEQRDAQERYATEGIIVGKNQKLYDKLTTYNVKLLYGNDQVKGRYASNSEVLLAVPIQNSNEGVVDPELEEGQKVILGYLNNDMNAPYIVNGGAQGGSTQIIAPDGYASSSTPATSDAPAASDGSSTAVTSTADIQDGTITVTFNKDGTTKTEKRNISSDIKWVYVQCINAGMTSAAACAILGNIDAESDFIPSKDNGNHHGLGQWDYSPYGRNKGDWEKATSGRWYDAMQWMNKHGYSSKHDTIEAQTAWFIYDIMGVPPEAENSAFKGEGTWVSKLKSDKNVGTTPITYLCGLPDSVENAMAAADIIREHYERCNEQAADERRQYAAGYFKFFQGQKTD